MERITHGSEQNYVPELTTAAAMLLLASYLSLGIFMIYKTIELFV